MKILHPFAWLAEAIQKKAFVILFFLTSTVMAVLAILDQSLITESVPLGIVSFEFAGSLSSAQSMVASWGAEAKIYAALSLGIDYLFMVLYAASISLGCSLTARAVNTSFLSRAGILLAWAQFLAVILDGIENYALIKLLQGSENALWPSLSFWCALPKFIIVLAGLTWIIYGAVLIVAKKIKRSN